MSIVRAAEVVVLIGTLYLACGAAFAPVFLWRGVDGVDPAARNAGLGFRLIVLPGVVALWPVLLRRWLAGQPPPEERNAHRDSPFARGGRNVAGHGTAGHDASAGSEHAGNEPARDGRSS